MIKVLYEDKDLVICVKPVGILSQCDSKGLSNMVDLLGEQLNADNKQLQIGVVHRLDKNVGGVMVYSKRPFMAGKLSALIHEREFSKEYLAIIHGKPENNENVFEDLLFKDSTKNKSFVVKRMRKGVKKASLEYKLIQTVETQDGEISLVKVKLHTGRTHQIRVQFASRKMPLLGDGKYGSKDNKCDVALWSFRLGFKHPANKKMLVYCENVPDCYPWNLFSEYSKIDGVD